MKVAVFGLGYVGTVTAAVLASNGHDVWGVDVDRTKTRLVADGASPVLEPGLDELVSATVAAGHLHATTSVDVALGMAEASLVCVGTPSSPNGGTDLSHVARAVSDIVSAFASGVACPRAGHALILRSTVPPGTVEELIEPLAATGTSGSPALVGAGMCPEFLREGSAIADFYESPISVLGTHEPWVGEVLGRLLSFLPSPVRVIGPRDAEALKYACNAFHATKIAFANELGRLFRVLGVDSRAVMTLFCQDTKLNLSSSYLAPGFAFGGSCLPKDLRSLLYLARTHFVDLPLLAGTMASNNLAVSDVVNRVLATGTRSVALLGLSFKAGSDDLRESPYVDLAETLIGKGFDVRIYDPVVDPARLVGANLRHLVSKLPHVRRALCPSAIEAVRGSELALVSAPDPSIVQALVRFPPPRIIDLSGRLGRSVETLASYEGVAW